MAINLKNLKHLKKGILDLTPLQLSTSRLSGYVGMVVGLSLATITTFLNKSWGIGIFLLFLTWFQSVGMIGEYQSNTNLKEIYKQTNVEEIDNGNRME